MCERAGHRVFRELLESSRQIFEMHRVFNGCRGSKINAIPNLFCPSNTYRKFTEGVEP